ARRNRFATPTEVEIRADLPGARPDDYRRRPLLESAGRDIRYVHVGEIRLAPEVVHFVHDGLGAPGGQRRDENERAADVPKAARYRSKTTVPHGAPRVFVVCWFVVHKAGV